MIQQGNISVSTENIFPIIKKFLYSDHDIFLRELISNAVDATQKLQTLSRIGDVKGELGETKIEIVLDEAAGTITVKDKGLGMTAEEINKYINQVAFSGAKEFVEKYNDKLEQNQIIGHFGLGFYSAFMVASKVEIITKSFKTDEAAKWSCDGSTTYTIEEDPRTGRGTDIILYINDESKEFLDKLRIQNILSKFCKFLPVEIEFDGKIINNPKPIWKQKPTELTTEDYEKFYNELYPFSEPPLFWIHLNVEVPFNLNGILYFPKVKPDVEPQRNKIQLYSNQVFVTDDVKDVVPEFLMLLHGIIDSPDIPLNVSRSYLQGDARVKQVNQYITRKVADKLDEMFRNEREVYENKWESINLFVKYGMISEEKFAEKARKFCLLTDIQDTNYTIDEYLEKVKPLQTDKDKKVVFLYTNDPTKQHAYIVNVERRGYNVLNLNGMLDNHFVQHLETKVENITLKRVDADTLDKLVDKDEKPVSLLGEDEEKNLKELFESKIANTAYSVETNALNTDDDFITITKPEFEQRMKTMSQMGGMSFYGAMPDTYKVQVNTNHPLASRVLKDSDDDSKAKIIMQSIDLAKL
ncbi:MAG: molecular chaperone HtpG, partial [Bacteroidetes bacterium]|nr:molecular chaperone HtpG [Bacteroidota bacterium]